MEVRPQANKWYPACAGYHCSYRVWRRRAITSANAPATNDVRPKIGPESELPVKGRLPPLAVVTAVGDDVDVEPRLLVGTVVAVVATVEPSPVIGVLDVGVGIVVVPSMIVEVVVDSVVLVVDSVVLVVDSVVLVVDSVVLVDVELLLDVDESPGVHCAVIDTDVVISFATLSGHCPNTSRTTLPVRPPGIVVVAAMEPLGGTSLPTAPTTANCCPPLSVAVALAMCIDSGVLVFPIVHVIRCAPSEHALWPESTSSCADAGSAVATANVPTNAATPAATIALRRTDRPDCLLERVLKGASPGDDVVR